VNTTFTGLAEGLYVGIRFFNVVFKSKDNVNSTYPHNKNVPGFLILVGPEFVIKAGRAALCPCTDDG